MKNSLRRGVEVLTDWLNWKEWRWGGIARAALVAGTGLAMLWISWGCWPDVLVDFAWQLYTPWQLIEGKVLYRDLALWKGPLSPYLNALWMECWGISLRSVVWGNLLVLSVIAALLYSIVSWIANRWMAATACVLLWAWFAFGQSTGIGNYNFVCPYAHELTHGLALALVGIYALMLFQRRLQVRWLALGGLAWGATLLTDVSVVVATTISLVSGVALITYGQRDRWMHWAIVVGAATLPGAVAVGLLSLSLPPRLAANAAFSALAPLASRDVIAMPFYRWGLGLDDLSGNLWKLLGASAGYAAICVPALWLAFHRRGGRSSPGCHSAGSPLAWVAFGTSSTILALVMWKTTWLADLARPFPLVLAGLAVATASAWRKARARGQLTTQAQLSTRLCLILFAFALLGKMFFNVHLYHYGFALAMPAALVVCTGALAWMPEWIHRRGGQAGIWLAMLGALVTVATVSHLLIEMSWWRQKRVVVGKGADAFMADGRGAYVNALLQELEGRCAAGESLAVLPEGCMINFLSRKVNPTPYFTNIPVEALYYGEAQIVQAYAENPADWVALVERDYSDLGIGVFGRDCGVQLMAWLKQHYEPVWRIGHEPFRGGQFGILLLRHRAESQGDRPGGNAQDNQTPL